MILVSFAASTLTIKQFSQGVGRVVFGKGPPFGEDVHVFQPGNRSKTVHTVFRLNVLLLSFAMWCLIGKRYRK